MRIRNLQGFEYEVSNPRRQSVNCVNLVSENRNESVQYALECNESKLHIDEEPVKNVSGEMAISDVVYFVYNRSLDPSDIVSTARMQILQLTYRSSNMRKTVGSPTR